MEFTLRERNAPEHDCFAKGHDFEPPSDMKEFADLQWPVQAPEGSLKERASRLAK